MNPSSSSCSNNQNHPPPPPPPPPPLSALAIFKNILNQELIRSVHLYRSSEEDGEERERWVEREFLFSPTSCIEMRAPILRPIRRLATAAARFQEGQMVGLWLCIFAFDSDSPLPSSVPPILSFPRNPRLKSIPTLARDLQKVFKLMSITENEDPMLFPSEDVCAEKKNESRLSGVLAPISYEDQVSHACPAIEQINRENQQSNHHVREGGVSLKKRRAATEHVASIALTDLAKYFNLPITEASRNLKVGLTVLKRKCREFGIPRWPHRKIKSLDTLIHNLQEEVNQQQKANKVAAVRAATRRQRMLESEKEGIERKPFMELQRETKRFRQDVFKRRHQAKSINKSQQTFLHDGC